MFRQTATLAAFAAVASAQLNILSPGGPNLWWVAQSTNVISWSCHENTNPQFSNFTILVTNSDPKILSGPEAIIAIEENFVCSQEVTVQQASLTPSTGYTVQLANPLNSSDVYAESQQFEVKALGAVYPASSATPQESGTASGSGTATGSAAAGATTTNSGSSPSSTSKSGAFTVGPSAVGALAGVAALFALVA